MSLQSRLNGIRWCWLLIPPLLYFLFFFGLSAAGLLGPDEPRYAAIGREMAASGDWVTPRLWGEAWFEKPALSYWLTGLGFRSGLGPETAPRLPVALLSTAFLVFYYLFLRREFGPRAAAFASAVLATSAGWIGFSFAAVTDLPMAAAFSAAMLLALPWVTRGERRGLPAAGALLGLAVLAKGLVPLVLSLPLLWFGRRRWRDLPLPLATMIAVAAPWYLLCTLANGTDFLLDFFWRHHFERFATEALKHRQPFWFYAPVLLAGLFPWTPALVLILRKDFYRGAARRFLLAVAVFGFVFFSASTNKLPGYLLPLLPPLCVLLGMALDQTRHAGHPLAASAFLIGLLPMLADILPDAVASGITRTSPAALSALWLLPAGVVAVLLPRWRREIGVALVAAAVCCGIVFLKAVTLPRLDREVSARPLWLAVASRRDQACVDGLPRALRYGLNYYSVTPLPDCAADPKPLRISGRLGFPPRHRDQREP